MMGGAIMHDDDDSDLDEDCIYGFGGLIVLVLVGIVWILY